MYFIQAGSQNSFIQLETMIQACSQHFTQLKAMIQACSQHFIQLKAMIQACSQHFMQLEIMEDSNFQLVVHSFFVCPL